MGWVTISTCLLVIAINLSYAAKQITKQAMLIPRLVRCYKKAKKFTESYFKNEETVVKKSNETPNESLE